jgi:hypothetical protein
MRQKDEEREYLRAPWIYMCYALFSVGMFQVEALFLSLRSRATEPVSDPWCKEALGMTSCIPRINRPVKWGQYIIIISKMGDGLCISYFKPNSDPRKSSDTDRFCLGIFTLRDILCAIDWRTSEPFHRKTNSILFRFCWAYCICCQLEDLLPTVRQPSLFGEPTRPIKNQFWTG